MSEKKWYKLIYKQVQPIHIGLGRFGVLGETRIFIPGWTMWGALTVAYNIQEGVKLDNNEDLFKEISNFFPAFYDNGKLIELKPCFHKGEFKYGYYEDGELICKDNDTKVFSEREFRAKFCDVLMSTAVLPISRQAMDASLHELEFILPAMKADVKKDDENFVRQLYWIGYVKVNENFNEFPKHIFIGGDRRYGYGLLEFEDKKPADNEEAQNPKLWYFDYNLVKNLEIEAHSQIELLPEFNFISGEKEKNYKANLENTGYYYMPGHNLVANNNQHRFYKGKIKEKPITASVLRPL